MHAYLMNNKINIKDLDIINQLKIYRIKVGDRIFNYNKSVYSSLKELVDPKYSFTKAQIRALLQRFEQFFHKDPL